MLTAILIYGPGCACSENLTKAFALRGEVRLISAHPTDWRGYDVGLVVDGEGAREQAFAIVDRADLLVIGEAFSFACLGQVCGPGWPGWAKRKRIMAFFGDSPYWKFPAYYEGMCQASGIRRIFLTPNLVPLAGMEAVPLHPPMPLMKPHRGRGKLTVMHSPGRDVKAALKGTATIEEVVRLLMADPTLAGKFEYKKLMGLPLIECLKEKSKADIFVDQMPPPGAPRGLGRSGLEGLAFGAATLSDIYPDANVRGFFDMPPVVRISGKETLEKELRSLLTDAARREVLQRQAREWVARTVELEPWLDYVERLL